jgi:hypothetical protein
VNRGRKKGVGCAHPTCPALRGGKSSYRNLAGGSGVEIAMLTGAPSEHDVGVRDSKDPHGPALTFTGHPGAPSAPPSRPTNSICSNLTPQRRNLRNSSAMRSLAFPSRGAGDPGQPFTEFRSKPQWGFCGTRTQKGCNDGSSLL